MKHLLLILSFLLLSSPLFGQSFVSVGNSGTILTSSDGILWTKRTSGKWEYLSGVTYGNGTFVAGGGTILTSSDGTTWTSSGEGGDIRGVTYGNSTFVTVKHSGAIHTSSDGTTWTSRSSGTSKDL